jgi:peptide deformylase
MNIIKSPDAILKERMPDFDFENPIMDPKELEQEMIKTMFENNGIGLSANQVGIKTRVFVIGHEKVKDQAMAFFNPVIVEANDKVFDVEEGCLSFPGIYVKIKRPQLIKAMWTNSSGEKMQGIFNDYDAKVFLHEFDHLEGITMQDRLSVLKWAMAIKKTKKRI